MFSYNKQKVCQVKYGTLFVKFVSFTYGIYNSANSAFLRVSSMAWRFPL